MLFAQQGGVGGQPGAAEAGILVAFVCGFLLIYLILIILFLLTVSNALKKCRSRNRTMEPGQVWLNLIPCFNIVWQFITVNRVADSLRNEFEDRGDRRESDSGRTLGMVSLILNIISGVISKIGEAVSKANKTDDFNAFDVVGLGLAMAAFFCFIIYWVKIAQYSRELDEEPDYDDEDDRPRRRRRRFDDEDEDDRPRQRRYDDDDDDRPRRRHRDDDDDRGYRDDRDDR